MLAAVPVCACECFFLFFLRFLPIYKCLPFPFWREKNVLNMLKKCHFFIFYLFSVLFLVPVHTFLFKGDSRSRI